MREELTEIVCVIDRSGSMEATKEDAIGGFNEFLKDQKEQDGEANLTMVLFDHEYEPVHESVDIQEVDPLTEDTYVPRGMTALYDAVGRTVDDLGSRLDDMDDKDKPGQVIFVILTDGAENSSKEYRHEMVKDRIEHQREKYNWEFIFLGSNIDAEGVAQSISIPTHLATTYASTGQGTNRAFAKSVNHAVSSYRASGSVSASWKDDSDSDESENSSDT